jgi:serine protease Do
LRTRRPLRTAQVGLALAFALTRAVAAPAAELTTLIQQHVRAASFEVVQLKPPDGEVTYDRDPPLDLIPYQQRIDKYRSIGTAFAIGPNRFVTASHVIGLGRGSQFGPPALRDTAGRAYDIDQVFKFSERRDFVVFSLREPPKGQKFLSPGLKPALNAAVYAVGNALGEGVIIRDGVYTSDTPEELDGQWKWLRFSAAASPGNSGGPLVDAHGKVIGIVLRKSPSENLNVALPYEELLNAKGEGSLGGRLPVRLPIIDASETFTFNETFELPKTLADMYAAVSERTLRLLWEATTKLREHNADHIFPRGAGSERLLHTIDRAAFPQLMHEDPNKVWVSSAATHQTVQLDGNGFIELSQGGIRLRAPDDVRLEKLYGDDKLYLDLLLKGYTLRRSVGSDSVRVTSLGKPRRSSEFTDRWGRTWQVRDWAIPYDDLMLTVASLRTPEGYVGTLNISGSGFIDAIHKSQELITNFLYLTLEGTLSQWQEYLAQKGAQPKAFDVIRIKIDSGQAAVNFHSDRYELEAKPDVLKLNKHSMLYLDFGFSGEGDAAVWNVNRVVVSAGSSTNNWIYAARHIKPPSSLPEGFQSSWNKLKNQSFPFDGMIESRNGETSISTSVRVPGAGTDATVRYALGVTAEGVQTQRDMSHKLDLLERSFKVLEQGGR